MGGGKSKTTKRKNNEGEPTMPSPPREGYRREGGLLTPASSSTTLGLIATTDALRMATIQEEDDTALGWKTKWIASQEAYTKACEGHTDALDG